MKSVCMVQDNGGDAESLGGSEILGPDGWDDVLSAWMADAGILGGPDNIPADEEVDPRYVVFPSYRQGIEGHGRCTAQSAVITRGHQ